MRHQIIRSILLIMGILLLIAGFQQGTLILGAGLVILILGLLYPVWEALLSAKNFRETLFLQLFSFLKIPVLFYLSPRVEQLDNVKCVIKLPMRRRAKNHLNSMYFAALSAGADCAGGLMAMRLILNSKQPISLIFKDFAAEFLKRAEGDVLFTCDQGEKIQKLVENAIDSTERVSDKVQVIATVPTKFGDEPVARFTLTISLKKRGKSA